MAILTEFFKMQQLQFFFIPIPQPPFPKNFQTLSPQMYTPSQRGNYHHIMFRNPTAALNLFHVGKQYLTLCKAEAAVTPNLIGRKIISNVKHADARNSLPIIDVIRSSYKRHSASEYSKWTLRQTRGVWAPSHFPTEYRHKAAVVSREHRMKWVVILGDCYQWPLPWECTPNESHCRKLFDLNIFIDIQTRKTLIQMDISKIMRMQFIQWRVNTYSQKVTKTPADHKIIYTSHHSKLFFSCINCKSLFYACDTATATQGNLISVPKIVWVFCMF